MSPRIEGFAIVSDDGMLADSRGVMPETLVIPADQTFLSGHLDRASLIVHGRNSHENQPQSPRRRRLIATRSIATLAPDADDPNATLWNPQNLPFDEALKALKLTDGLIAVLGGTDIFGMFLPRYDCFHLSRAAGVKLPGGRAVFPGVPEQSPEEILAAHGFVASKEIALDAARGATLVDWRRKP
jgi:dihydrofolate reductase